MNASVARIARASMVIAKNVRMNSSAAAKAEHAAWLKKVTALPVVEAEWTMSLEFALPTPVPLHQFTQSPIVVEVKNRNPEYEH